MFSLFNTLHKSHINVGHTSSAQSDTVVTSRCLVASSNRWTFPGLSQHLLRATELLQYSKSLTHKPNPYSPTYSLKLKLKLRKYNYNLYL
jgi:hypothetical protein